MSHVDEAEAGRLAGGRRREPLRLSRSYASVNDACAANLGRPRCFGGNCGRCRRRCVSVVGDAVFLSVEGVIGTRAARGAARDRAAACRRGAAG